VAVDWVAVGDRCSNDEISDWIFWRDAGLWFQANYECGRNRDIFEHWCQEHGDG
jgi:hypothetical protein